MKEDLEKECLEATVPCRASDLNLILERRSGLEERGIERLTPQQASVEILYNLKRCKGSLDCFEVS